MKMQNKSFAIVLDEYGGMHGIITMNDLISRLIGDFSSDNEEAPQRTQIALEKIDENLWTVRGNVPLSDIVRETGAELPVDDVDTFSGMVFSALGSIPDDGATMELDASGLHIRVLEIVDHQIESAEFSLIDPPKVEDEDDDDSDELFPRKKKKDDDADARDSE